MNYICSATKVIHSLAFAKRNAGSPRVKNGRTFLFPLGEGFFISLMENEVWKNIDGFEGLYMVSNLGRVKSLERVMNRGRMGSRIKGVGILKDCKRGEYISITLSDLKGGALSIRLHRLVALHFIPNPENKPQVNHKNGIKTDNRVENLEWVTCGENLSHALKNGLRKQARGESMSQSKLKNEDVVRVKKMLMDGFLQKEIAKIFNVHSSQISRINTNSRWNHVGFQ